MTSSSNFLTRPASVALLVLLASVTPAQETSVGVSKDEAHFAEQFARCSRQAGFRALDQWCRERGHEEWRETLAPFLASFAPVGEGARAREVDRRRGARVLASVSKRSQHLIEDLSADLEELMGWMAEESHAPETSLGELQSLIDRAIAQVGGPERADMLLDLLSGLSDGDHEARARKRLDRSYRKRLDRVMKGIASRSLAATKDALAIGQFGLAFDLFRYVLRVDPDNSRAHRSLGHKQVRGVWLRPYEATQMRRGLTWDGARGWILAGARERYEQGLIFDEAADEWLPLEEASRRHADPRDPWVIRTEHFELRSTADLDRTAWIAERLEDFYVAAFRQYDTFFRGKKAARLIFGVADAEDPLVVNFYRNHAQYLGHGKGLASSAGYYSKKAGASFFFDQGEDLTTLQHELTHQILGEASPGKAPAWLAEGSATYLEGLRFEDGAPVRDSQMLSRRLCTYRQLLSTGGELSFSEVVALTSQEKWNRNLCGANYRGAAAVVHFVCQMDDGRYRADAIDMLHDAYLGEEVRIEDYVNLSVESLDMLMRHFYGAD